MKPLDELNDRVSAKGNPRKHGRKIAVLGWGRSVHTRKWVKAIAARGYRVKLVGLTGGAIDGVESVLFRRRNRLSYLTRVISAVRAVNSFKPDLLHVHYAAGFGLWGILCRIHPTVVSVWGADIIDFPSRLFTRALIRAVLSKAVAICATSRMLKERVVELVPKAEDKTTVIPFGVSVGESPAKDLPPEPVKICFLKSLFPKYGPDVLLKAMSLALPRYRNLRLSIAGEGPMENRLRDMAAELELRENVEFQGLIPHHTVYEFLSRHHFMVMPSTMESESFGVAVLEAAACGRPTIASRIGGVPEVIRHGETGVLVEPNDPVALADSIVTMARDAERRRAMGAAAFDFVKEKYDWNNSVDMMTSLYERVIDDAKKNTSV